MVKKFTHFIGDLEFTLISDVYDGEIGDAEVKIGDKSLCWISGNERNNFINEFENLIAKYRI